MAAAITSKPSARDIAACNDEQLDRYLEENGRWVFDSMNC
jgi:hypothetical protein